MFIIRPLKSLKAASLSESKTQAGVVFNPCLLLQDPQKAIVEISNRRVQTKGETSLRGFDSLVCSFCPVCKEKTPRRFSQILPSSSSPLRLQLL